MQKQKRPAAINASDIPPRIESSTYPPPFAAQMEGRIKHQLGDFFGLKNFGVNLTRLKPNAVSALRHAHSKQDEFIYILEGSPTLQSNEGNIQLSAGMCAGTRAGSGIACNLINKTKEDVLYLEIGDRTPGDKAVYPDDDLQASMTDGRWQFFHKDGTPY